MNNWQWIVKAPIYVNLKKHYCPGCCDLLKVVKVSKVVFAGSPESKKLGLDFNMVGGVYQNGKVKVIWKEFACSRCNRRITVEEMKEIEGYTS
ncbi:MAG: hypothetical protein J6C92_11170 [Bacteroidaceae bacterium]|nr:hypothetical protein [Bacteroidaceae bacterium]